MCLYALSSLFRHLILSTLTHFDLFYFFFFFNDTATTEIYTLSLHDALPICVDRAGAHALAQVFDGKQTGELLRSPGQDRKSTRLNSSHVEISYAVFCLKKKKKFSDCNESLKTAYIGHSC